MKEVMLKIVGVHVREDIEEEQMELITEGRLQERNGVLYLTYEESEFTGLVGCKTRLRVEGDTVKMSRIGKDSGVSAAMNFEKGKKHVSLYNTPMGAVGMELVTNDLINNLSPEGKGNVVIDYSISLEGLTNGRSKLNIEIV